MNRNQTDPLAIFNQLYKEMDEIYHLYAKQCGISDAAFWLLYSLYEAGSSQVQYTQRELCSDWHYPPQTINSALKNLEKKGLLFLEPVPGNQKNKRIVLSDQGQALVEQIIAPLVQAERRTFQGLTEEEQTVLLSLTRKYVELLRTEIN